MTSENKAHTFLNQILTLILPRSELFGSRQASSVANMWAFPPRSRIFPFSLDQCWLLQSGIFYSQL